MKKLDESQSFIAPPFKATFRSNPISPSKMTEAAFKFKAVAKLPRKAQVSKVTFTNSQL